MTTYPHKIELIVEGSWQPRDLDDWFRSELTGKIKLFKVGRYYEYRFQKVRDATLFKLFWIG